MSINWPAIRHRFAATAAIAAVACASLIVNGSVSAGTATEVDVMAWLDDVDPAITIDQSNKCMAGATDAVAYRNDHIVMRTTANDASVKSTLNTKLHLMYGGPSINYVGPIERITFPNTPPANTPVTPVLSVTLLPRPSGLPHDVVGLARRLRSESHIPSSPDYAVTPEGPYGHYWPKGYPEKISTLTPPRTNVVPLTSNLIGTGVKIQIDDTGLAPTTPAELPTTSQFSSNDNELIDVVNNGPLMADNPAVGHGKAIAGTIYTTAPGTTIQELRINDRSGLMTDVSAARAIASSLQTMPRADYPALMVNAFSTAVCDGGPGTGVTDLRPVGMEAVVEVVDKFDPYQPNGMLIVASAGNLATRRPHYPAAFESVVGVGALDGNIDGDLSPWSSPARTAPIADFSDRGPWVDVYALGVDIPTTHVSGVRFQDGGDIIEGKASVSGTSFSAPIFTGYLAEVISTGKIKARAAYAQLKLSGKAPLPQCGTTAVETGKAVVLSSLTATATGPATGQPVTC
jgi:hypothetical protein